LTCCFGVNWGQTLAAAAFAPFGVVFALDGVVAVADVATTRAVKSKTEATQFILLKHSILFYW
jgi:hypothetical protein